MNDTRIQAVRVWPGWLRLSHWLAALGVLFLLFSGWARQVDVAQRAFWHDWHLIVGQMLMLVVGLRTMLLFSPGVTHWRTLLNLRGQWPAMRETLLCYLSLGRLSMPNYHAHNPLWKPIYLLFWLVLAVMIVSGMLLGHRDPQLAQASLHLHSLLAGVITGFVVVHGVAAFVHDNKAEGGTVSAMINGVRYFHHPAAQNTPGGIPLVVQQNGAASRD